MKVYSTFLTVFLLFIGYLTYSQTETEVTSNTKFKLEGTFAFNYTGSLGYYWNLNKSRAIKKSQFGLGFRLESFLAQFWLVGPSLDWYKIIGQQGKVNPLYGFQVGFGFAGTPDFLIDDLFFNFSPYAGVNIRTQQDFELDITFQLRSNLTGFGSFPHILPTLGAAFRF